MKPKILRITYLATILLLTACNVVNTTTPELETLIFPSPVTSTNEFITDESFTKDYSFDLSSNPEAAILETSTNHLVYDVNKDNLTLKENITELIIIWKI